MSDTDSFTYYTYVIRFLTLQHERLHRLSETLTKTLARGYKFEKVMSTVYEETLKSWDAMPSLFDYAFIVLGERSNFESSMQWKSLEKIESDLRVTLQDHQPNLAHATGLLRRLNVSLSSCEEAYYIWTRYDKNAPALANNHYQASPNEAGDLPKMLVQ